MGKEKAKKRSFPETEQEPISPEHQKIIEWLKKVRFKKQMLGGVSEADVWKKIDELNKLYEEALAAERIRCETLLKEYRSGNLPAGSEGGE